MSQLKMVRKENALKDVFKTFELDDSDDTDLKTYLEMVAPHVEKQIKEELKKDKSLKVEMAVTVNMARRSDDKISKQHHPFALEYNTLTAQQTYSRFMKI